MNQPSTRGVAECSRVSHRSHSRWLSLEHHRTHRTSLACSTRTSSSHIHTNIHTLSSLSFLACFPHDCCLCSMCFSPLITITHILFIKSPFRDRGSFQNLGMTKLPSPPFLSLSFISSPLLSRLPFPYSPALRSRLPKSSYGSALSSHSASGRAECILVQFICKIVS